MLVKIVFLLLTIVLLQGQCFAQHDIVVPETDSARLFMASFIAVNSSSPFLFCAGTFIRQNHVLTAASCVYGRILASYRIHSGAANMMNNGIGTPHFAERVFIHPDFNSSQPLENNLAVVYVRLVSDSNTRPITLEPRGLGAITFNRFCSMMGWEGFQATLNWIPLRLFPIVVANASTCQPASTQAHCSSQTSIAAPFPICGGLMGSPVFCSGDSVSGIVVHDNFCQGANPIGGRFISVHDFQSWINEVSGARISSGMSLTLLFASMLILLQNLL